MVLEGKYAPECIVVYNVRNANTILCIGKSSIVENQLAQQLRYAAPSSRGYFDESAREDIQYSQYLCEEFMELPQEDTREIGNQAQIDYWIRKIQASLIWILFPKYNLQCKGD